MIFSGDAKPILIASNTHRLVSFFIHCCRHAVSPFYSSSIIYIIVALSKSMLASDHLNINQFALV